MTHIYYEALQHQYRSVQTSHTIVLKCHLGNNTETCEVFELQGRGYTNPLIVYFCGNFFFLADRHSVDFFTEVDYQVVWECVVTYASVSFCIPLYFLEDPLDL